MKHRLPTNQQVLFTIVLTFIFWYLTFGVKLLNFWLSMSIAASILTLLSVRFTGLILKGKDITVKNLLLGLITAGVLYGVFAVGNYLSQLLFTFAKPEVSSIYGIRQEGQAIIIALVLLFVTSPAEELFWRGFLQRWAMARLGGLRGWLAASFIYAAVHVLSGNFMLTMAALIAGLFWGLVYWRTGSIFVCIISHAIWTVSIFVLWPLH